MKSSISFESTLTKFGIGLFETIKVKDKPIKLDLHLDRLFNSIYNLNLNFKYDKTFIKDKVLKYIKENKIHNKALRITICEDGYNFSTRDISYKKEHYEKGLNIITSPIIRGDSIIYRHKTTNFYENIYSKNYANKKGYDDALFLNYDNLILECSVSNIFFIKDKKIITPSLKLPILNGTVRKRVIEYCKDLGVDIEEREINISEINLCDFSFVSNSLMGIMKVRAINDKKFNEDNKIFNKIKLNLEKYHV